MSTDMQFEYDPERLIEEVRKRPGIWDFENEDYRTKSMRYQLWNEVVQQLIPDHDKMSKAEIRELELQLQKKWKSIRDCFQKQLAHPNKSKRPYIYTKHLQFLMKNQTDKSQKDDESSDSEDKTIKVHKRFVTRKRTIKVANKEETSSDNDIDFANNDDSDDAIEINVPLASKRGRLSGSAVDDFAFASVDSQSSEDPDKLFLLSLIPHMKSVPEEYRLNVKMDILQVLRNANYPDTMDHKLL